MIGFQPLTDESLQEVTRRIVDVLTPEQVVLFGSYTEGRATKDSDLDLLVVTSHPVDRKERQARKQG